MEILIYFLKANIFLVIFYGFYFALFRNETFHKANRFFLIMGAILALTLPFMKSEYFQKNEMVSSGIQEIVYEYYLDTEEIVVNPVAESVTYLDAINYFYLLGLGFSLCFLAYRLMKTLDWVKNHKNAKGTAFSFLGKVFVDNQLQGKMIIQQHENIHVKQRHFIDLLLLEMLQIVFWFNPVVYFYKKSIAIIHEFLADEAATQIATNKAEYATLLINKQFNIQPATIFTQHFFNHSTLKSRIIMLSKNPSKKTALLKYGLLAPLFFALLLVSSFTVDKSTNLQTVLEKMETNISQNTITKSNVFSFEEIKPEESIIHLKIAEKQENKAVTSLNFLPIDEDVQIDNLDFPNLQKDTVPQSKTPKEIFTVAEQSPGFVGGTKELYRWLGSKIKYPKAAQRANVSGSVFVKFIVEADGSIDDVKIMKGIGFGCDEEAIRVIKTMPKWNPGIQNGRPVAVYYNMPIVFKLDGPKEGKKGIDDNEKIGVTDLNNSNESKIVGTFPIGVKKEKSTTIGILHPHEKALFFIDGVEIIDLKLANLSPSSIESISIVKAEQAIKTYGEKGKNDVVLIKTKTNFIKTDDKK